MNAHQRRLTRRRKYATWATSSGRRIKQKMPPPDMVGIVPDGAVVPRAAFPGLWDAVAQHLNNIT